ncbi:MAG TPA: pectinesterase family protein [Opitutaceae bacterium]|nr:pectinesterase family protein [Opitutaceae bacterium]
MSYPHLLLRRCLPLLLPVLALLSPACHAAGASTAPRDALPILFVCGDSTAARDRPPILGWGEVVGEFFNPARIHVENHAMGGRSARTFIEEGRWAAVRDRLRPGDIVLLQFGHNDSKSSLSIARYDLSGVGDEVVKTTNPLTGAPVEIRTFGYYMRQMVSEGKARGATVIVLSSVPRCNWRNGKIVRGEEQHGPWAAEVARAEGVPFVDANGIIAAVYDPVGRARLKALYFPQDNTHTNPVGARLNAACIVSGLAALNDAALNGDLKPDAVATARAVIAGVSNAAAAVKVTPPLTHAFPKPGATNVCPDTPLRLTFFSPPSLGASGRIHIVDAATGRDADTVDVSAPTAYETIGGEPNYRYYPVIISGNEATIYPHNGALEYGHTYYVTADAGVFQDGGPNAGVTIDPEARRKLAAAVNPAAAEPALPYAALDQSAGWTFTTKAAPPARGTTRLTVAADGSGDFCTVQGAIDFVPDGNTTPTTIFIRKGTYIEEVFFTNKHALTFEGEDRHQTVIAYATNDRFNRITGNPFGTNLPNPAAARTGSHHIYHRGVFLAHHVNDLVLTNLTIRNTTPQGGSQAEAIILNGSTTARAIIKDVDLYSYQDTLQINGQAYLSGCYIEGDIDFMWGTGPCYFENCTCRSLRSGAYYTQIRNPGTNHGYVYDHCTFDGSQGVMGNYLSRIGTGRFPHSEVVLLDCTLTRAVGPVAWLLLGGREGNPTDPAQVHFWEFNSHDPAGRPVDMTFRLPASKRLVESTDSATIANYRNPTFVLGHDWNPKAAPIYAHPPAPTPEPTVGAGGPAISLQPRDTLALLGAPATLTVAASGTAGRLLYQWAKDGTPVAGGSSPTLRIPSMAWNDAGVYTVTVRNMAGAATSAAARLTAVAPQASPAPDLPRIPDATFDVTSFGAVADGTTDNTAAFQGAIDTAIQAGGGTVVVPAAEQPYLCGPLRLGSNLAFEVDAGATIRLLPYSATPRPGAYPLQGRAYPNFLTAVNAHDVAITGGGTINGEGDAWWAAFRADRRMPHRPFLVRFTKCERVLVAGLTFTHSPMFHVAIGADHLTVFGITVHTPESPNTDGVDPSGSHHLIQNCAISCGDDNVVMKPGGSFCSDITIADCAFDEGHGMSVGGQSNRGLDGMVVKNCSFDGTTSGLRLKADPTQGGPVQNVTYTNLSMEHVKYPIVFYSYYSKVGNPAATSGKNETTPAKAQAWNEKPPYSLASPTLSGWKNITVSGLFSADTKGYSIIWGLPLPGYLIENVKLDRVRIAGGPGFELYNATGVEFGRDTEVGAIRSCNALAIVQSPHPATVATGATVTFATQVLARQGVSDATVTYQWHHNGQALNDGSLGDGTTVSGATTAKLTLAGIHAKDGGKYTVTTSAALDGFDPAKGALVPASVPASATSAPAELTVRED